MAAEILDITSYNPRSSDIFFFDNNIWMFLYCPISDYNKRKQQIFSKFLQQVTSAGAAIFINSLILSEFANANFRLDFDLWKEEESKLEASYKKDFVGSVRYKETAEEIKSTIHQILKVCEKSPDDFNAVDIHRVLTHLDSIDFNDSYYLELASLKNWKIVTDDRDFVNYKNHECTVITML